MNNYYNPTMGPMYGGYQQPQQAFYGYGGYTDPYSAGFQPQTYMFNNIPQPSNVSSLTEEEVAMLRQSHNKSKIDINVSQDDFTRAMCNHVYNGKSVVQQINDGSGEVWCPICDERWNPSDISRDDAVDLVKRLCDAIQNMKMVGNFPVEVIRDYCTILPLLKKFPDLYDAAIANYNKYVSPQPFSNAGDNSIYSQYEYLSRGMVNQPYMYQQPYAFQQPQFQQQGPAYYQQAPQAQPQMQGYYGQGNPMQADANSPQTVYGGAPNPQQQFTPQPYMPAGMMQPQPYAPMGMPAQVPYAQPVVQQPQMAMNPVTGQPAPQGTFAPISAAPGQVQSTPEQTTGDTASKDQQIKL